MAAAGPANFVARPPGDRHYAVEPATLNLRDAESRQVNPWYGFASALRSSHDSPALYVTLISPRSQRNINTSSTTRTTATTPLYVALLRRPCGDNGGNVSLSLDAHSHPLRSVCRVHCRCLVLWLALQYSTSPRPRHHSSLPTATNNILF